MARKAKYAKPLYLSAAARHELFQLQDGRCAICREEVKDLEIDHSHRSAATRGLLCKGCNVRLRGYRSATFGDSPKRMREEMAWLRAALRYLRTPPAKALAKAA